MARKNRLAETARPAPFTPEQVASLVAGQANMVEVGKLLTAHRQPRLQAPASSKQARVGAAPIPISAADLRELAIGGVPDSVRSRLDDQAAKRRARATPTRAAGARPTRRPT